MKKLLILAAPIVLAACSPGGADADGDGEISQQEAAAETSNISITPGQWETTVQLTEFEMTGMPEEAREMMRRQMGQSRTSTSCITPEEAANPQATMFGGDENDSCTYNDFTMSGGTMLIDATCRPEGTDGTMTMRMEGTYTAARYDMTINMTMPEGPMGAMSMAGRVSGRNISPDCDAQ